MPVFMETTSRAARAAGLGYISRTTANALAALERTPHEVIANAHLREVQLLEMSRSMAEGFAEFARRPIVWTSQDGNCGYRAAAITRHANQVMGSGLTATEDAMFAGIAVLEMHPPGTPIAPDKWVMHIASALNIRDEGVHVIDGLHRRTLLPIREWGSFYKVPVERQRVLSPYAGDGLTANQTNRYTWERVQTELAASWDSVESYGHEVLNR